MNQGGSENRAACSNDSRSLGVKTSKERTNTDDQEGGNKQEKVSLMVLQDCKESTNPDEKEVLIVGSVSTA